jgi:hypothetical protein
MDRDQYFVVLHKGEWEDKARHSHPYPPQRGAISGAVEAAKQRTTTANFRKSSFRVKTSHSALRGPTARTRIRLSANQI